MLNENEIFLQRLIRFDKLIITGDTQAMFRFYRKLDFSPTKVRSRRKDGRGMRSESSEKLSPPSNEICFVQAKQIKKVFLFQSISVTAQI